MTPYLYWRGDPWLAAQYREMEKIRLRERNMDAWLHGLYVFHAFMAGISNLNFGGGNKKPAQYLEKPLSILKEDIEAEKRERQEKERQKFISAMNAWKADWDRQKGNKVEN